MPISFYKEEMRETKSNLLITPYQTLVNFCTKHFFMKIDSHIVQPACFYIKFVDQDCPMKSLEMIEFLL